MSAGLLYRYASITAPRLKYSGRKLPSVEAYVTTDVTNGRTEQKEKV